MFLCLCLYLYQTRGSCEAAAARGYKGKNGRHGRRAAKEAGSGEAWDGMGAAARRARVSLPTRWLALVCMLDGAGSAGQPAWANRVSLPLQQTGATRTIVSNPRPIGSRLLCAYPFTPARQTLTHPADLRWSPESAARVSTTQRRPSCVRPRRANAAVARPLAARVTLS